MVGGSCLSSPARIHFGALNTAIQQLASIACRTMDMVIFCPQEDRGVVLDYHLCTLVNDNHIKVILGQIPTHQAVVYKSFDHLKY